MFKEIALDPACFSEFEYYQLFKQSFGFDKGRYAVIQNKDWAREAMTALKSVDGLKPIRKKSIANLINKLSRSKQFDGVVLTHDRKNVTANNWHEWWLKQDELREFDLTISEKIDGAQNIDELLEDREIKGWQISSTWSVIRKPKDIISELHPLIQISERAILIDQYFRVDHNPVLERLLSTLSTENISELTIVSAQNTERLDQVFKNNYLPLMACNLKLKWVRAPDKFFHARFFITDKGAISSDYGFMDASEKGAHSDLAVFGLVSKSVSDGALESLDTIIQDSRASVNAFNY